MRREEQTAVKTMQGNKITFKPVTKKTNSIARNFEEAEGMFWVDVYEGYKKLGRFTLAVAKVKFR